MGYPIFLGASIPRKVGPCISLKCATRYHTAGMWGVGGRGRAALEQAFLHPSDLCVPVLHGRNVGGWMKRKGGTRASWTRSPRSSNASPPCCESPPYTLHDLVQVYIYVRIHTCIYICICTCIYAPIYLYLSMYLYIYTYTYLYMFTYIYIYICKREQAGRAHRDPPTPPRHAVSRTSDFRAQSEGLRV